MNWFERHLNWTAGGIIIGSIIFTSILVSVSVSFNFYFSLFPFLPILAILLTAGFVLTITGHGWILYHKKQNLSFLTFYLPSFILSIICLIIVTINPIPSEDTIGLMILYLLCIVSNIGILLTGWIFLLLLKNLNLSSIKEIDGQTRSTKETENYYLNRLYHSSSRLKHTCFSIAGVAILISFGSFFFINYGHFTYHFDGSSSSEIPGFSVEYPPSYRVERPMTSYTDSVFLSKGYYSEIEIGLVNNDWHSIVFTPPDEQTLVTELYSRITSTGIMEAVILPATILPTSIDGIPGIYTTLNVENLHNYENYSWGTGTGVIFKHGNTYFFISCVEHKKLSTIPPPYFTHLLESFKFHDK
jgi:hypothetical protein